MGTTLASKMQAIKTSNVKIVEYLKGRLLGASNIQIEFSSSTDLEVKFMYKLRSPSSGGLIQSMVEAKDELDSSGITIQSGKIESGSAVITVLCNRALLGL